MNYLASHLPKGEKIYAKTHKSAFIFMRDVLIAVLLFGIAVGVQLGFKVDTKIMIWGLYRVRRRGGFLSVRQRGSIRVDVACGNHA